MPFLDLADACDIDDLIGLLAGPLLPAAKGWIARLEDEMTAPSEIALDRIGSARVTVLAR